jgi:GTP-binding protein HflX
MWSHLSKQFGGIGTKGPGETQIESDRRALRIKIQRLKEKLNEIDIQKEQQKKGRSLLPRFALVGYTNAGKSTLMNQITEAKVYVEDKLFATLDTTVRVFTFPNGQKALLSDTVGFIRKLPHHLVASFRSTLAEAGDADILLHIVDVSHGYFREQIRAVLQTLEELKLDDKPVITVFNKIDLLNDFDEVKMIENEFPDCIFVSAERGINIVKLLELMQNKYSEQSLVLNFILPYSAMELVSIIYETADILNRTDMDEGIQFEVRVPKEHTKIFMNHFEEYVN